MRVQLGFGVELDKYGNPVGYCPTLEKEILKQAVGEFGGATIIPVIGAWRSGRGDYVQEHGRILQIDAIAYEDLYKAKRLAEWVKEVLRQESVCYTVFNVETEFV